MVSFVILHYKNIKDTIECLASIKKMKTHTNYSIVVVINESKNSDDLNAIKEYTTDIVEIKENIGFAKANNLGCKYAIKKYEPDFIAVINNDTIIEQDKFLEEIYQIYKDTNFDILGPKIITHGGNSVNPFPVYKSEKEIKKALRKTEMLNKIYKNKILRYLLGIYINVKSTIIKPKNLKNGDILLKNIALHGCAIIFSKKYYKKYKHPFYNDTFLYHEEEFLYYRVIKDKLISIYDPNLELIHKEGASLNNNFNNSYYEKMIFRNKYILDSLQKLLIIIQKNKKI